MSQSAAMQLELAASLWKRKLKIEFSFAGMPQGFNPNPAFKSKDIGLIKTKNTEIRENFDNERSIGGIEEPIRG